MTVYSVFAGLGKTELSKQNKMFIDLESSRYQWQEVNGKTEEKTKGLVKTKNPNFPSNYVEDIISFTNKGKNVLIAAQPEVLAALSEEDIPFISITPYKKDKDIILDRYRKRGNPESFISLMDRNFESFIDSMDNNKNAEKNLKLQGDLFLSDMLG